MLGDELLTRPRMSRIYYHDRFFEYPLGAQEVFRGLGDDRVGALRAVLPLLATAPAALQPKTFEDWVVGRFGRRLYDAFFRSYTEKVWGIPGSEIQAEWAAQRIQDFSFWQALLGILGLHRGHAPTLIEDFLYPRLGPGQMWEEFAESTSRRVGSRSTLNRRVRRDQPLRGPRREHRRASTTATPRSTPVDGVLSSIALPDLIRSLDPPAPAAGPRGRRSSSATAASASSR